MQVGLDNISYMPTASIPADGLLSAGNVSHTTKHTDLVCIGSFSIVVGFTQVSTK
jgi:hypothetical protein